MLCLLNSISQKEPALQTLVQAIENAPTFTELILSAWHLAMALAVKIVEDELNRRAQKKTLWEQCSHCGHSLQSKGFLKREIKTLIGKIVWHRRAGRCPNSCKIGQVTPLDEELGLESHQRASFELKYLALISAVFLPFETASLFVKRFTNVHISPAGIWWWVQDFGHRAEERLAEKLEQLENGQNPTVEPMDEKISTLPLAIGGDGVMVPFRPKKGSPKGRTRWQEVKVAVLARLGSHTTRNGDKIMRLKNRRLVAVFGSIDALSPRLWLEALRQDVLNAGQVVWLSDGGRGFWRLYRERFSTIAIGVLDFYHAVQNLWKGYAVWLDGRTKKARTKFKADRHKLRHGQSNSVLDDILSASELEGLPDSASKALTKLYTYLDKHRKHIDYENFEALGLPLGSGMVESACKWLIQQRFKGVGMRWSEAGFNHLLHLRLDWVNGRFDDFALATSPSPNL